MKDFEDLFIKYKGTLVRDGNRIIFTNRNTIYDYWGKPRNVMCEIEVDKNNDSYFVSAEEQTLEILGGHAGSWEKEKALSIVSNDLHKYCFVRKAQEQLKLL